MFIYPQVHDVYCDYRLSKRLSHNRSTTVWLADHVVTGNQVVVKMLAENNSLEIWREGHRRLTREAEVLAFLNHPGILRSIEFERRMPFLAVDFQPGGNLFHQFPTTYAQLISWVTQVADAIDYIHLRGLIHRDIKPTNILVNKMGCLVVGDFGITQEILFSCQAPNVVESKDLLGTPQYASPEQWLGLLDYRSDIYSLGVMVFEWITRCLPFNSPSWEGYYELHLSAPVPPSGYGVGVDAVLQTALAKNPSERYQTAREFACAFELAILEVLRNPPVAVTC